jgi:hypothetical protein
MAIAADVRRVHEPPFIARSAPGQRAAAVETPLPTGWATADPPQAAFGSVPSVKRWKKR